MQMYNDETSLATIVAQVAAQARRVSQPTVIITTSSRRAKVLKALEVERVVLDDPAASPIEILDGHQVLQTIMESERPVWARFSVTMRSVLDRLCAGRELCVPVIYADMGDVLVQAENTSAALALETMWNRLATEYKFSLLCGYSAVNVKERVPADRELQAICDQHNYIRRATN
jgi:hypothetical protein